MSISALGSTTAGATISRLAPAPDNGFAAQMSVAVGQGRAAHGHGARNHGTQATGTQETGTPAQATGAVSASAGAAPVHTLADDARALVGDVFGALGADTPTAVTAQRAIQAYRQAG